MYYIIKNNNISITINYKRMNIDYKYSKYTNN